MKLEHHFFFFQHSFKDGNLEATQMEIWNAEKVAEPTKFTQEGVWD